LRARRTYGESHYNLWRMSRFAVAGILSGSTFPLRFILYLALFLTIAFPAAAFSLRLGGAAAARLAVFVGLYFLLVSVPALALYLARAYKNGMARPVFVIDRTRTFLE
jgi:dolichol-phosphate mannosyltransferase